MAAAAEPSTPLSVTRLVTFQPGPVLVVVVVVEVAVDAGAILLGQERLLTGAHSQRPGCFESAGPPFLLQRQPAAGSRAAAPELLEYLLRAILV